MVSFISGSADDKNEIQACQTGTGKNRSLLAEQITRLTADHLLERCRSMVPDRFKA
jgi:hypothetical protein